MLPTIRLFSLYTTIASVLLLAGCNNPSQERPLAEKAVENARDTSALYVMDANRILTMDPQVPATELRAISADFNAFFMLGPVGKEQTIPQGQLRFQVGDLKHLMDSACAHTAPPMRAGVVVHFGLDKCSKFVAALEAVCIIGDPYSAICPYKADTIYYQIDGGKLAKIDSLAWDTVQAQQYKKNVVIQHSTGEYYKAFDPTIDISYEVFPYSELQELIYENALADTDSLELRPISTPLNRPIDGAGAVLDKDRRQGVCFVPVGSNVKLDDRVDPSNVFKNKAADLGAACPPYCLKALFKPHGISPRTHCK